MKPDPETQLHERFSELRHAEREAAPVWNLPVQSKPRHEIIHRDPQLRWAIPALIAIALLFWIKPTRQSLADLPAWPKPAPGHLFAETSTASSTDFLLPTHLNIKLP
jgi:hypothetical protein